MWCLLWVIDFYSFWILLHRLMGVLLHLFLYLYVICVEWIKKILILRAHFCCDSRLSARQVRKIFTSIEHLLQPAAGAQHYFATLPLTKPQAQCFVKQLNNRLVACTSISTSQLDAQSSSVSMESKKLATFPSLSWYGKIKWGTLLVMLNGIETLFLVAIVLVVQLSATTNNSFIDDVLKNTSAIEDRNTSVSSSIGSSHLKIPPFIHHAFL